MAKKSPSKAMTIGSKEYNSDIAEFCKKMGGMDQVLKAILGMLDIGMLEDMIKELFNNPYLDNIIVMKVMENDKIKSPLRRLLSRS